MSLGEGGTPLVIVTAQYPFGRGEAFFASELGHLARRFSSIVVLPCHRPEGPVRAVPTNVDVADALYRDRAGMAQRILTAPFVGIASADFWHEWQEQELRLADPRSFGRCLNHLEQAKALAHRLDQFLAARHVADDALCYSYWATPAAIAACLVKRRRPQLKAVARFHGFDLYEDRHLPAYIPYRRILAEELDLLLFVSSAGANYFASRHPAPPERMVVNRLGVDGGRAPGLEPVTDEPIHLVTCSFVRPVKRLELFVAGLAKFAETYPGVALRWTHIGDGPGFAALKRQAAEWLGPPVCVRFVGHLSNADVLRFYRTEPVTALVNVSKSEGLPVSFMEAMSFGIPVVAPDVGGIREIVTSASGMLLPADPKPLEIVEALGALAFNHKLRRELRAGAYAKWRAAYQSERNATALAESLEQLRARGGLKGGR